MRAPLLFSITAVSLSALLAGCSPGANQSAPAAENAASSTNEAAPAENVASSANEAAPAGNAQDAAPPPAGAGAILVNLERVGAIPATPNDQVSVSNVRFVSGIGGHFITANVRYGGGCRPHEFKAYWDGSWARSLPPGIAITLRHNANGDRCKALFNRTVQINISGPAAAEREFWVQLTNVPGSAGRVDVRIP